MMRHATRAFPAMLLLALGAAEAVGDEISEDGRFITIGRPGQHATEYEGVPYRFVGVPMRAHLLLTAFDVEGSMYSLEDQLSLRGCEASRLHLMLASAWSSFVPTDTPVVTLEVYYADGSEESHDLLQGVDVCEWVLPGPDDEPMAHIALERAYTWFPMLTPGQPTGRQDLQGNYYHVAFELRPKPLDHIEMRMPEAFQRAISKGVFRTRRYYASVGAVTLQLP